MLSLIQEINVLWEPVYPYLARHVKDEYRRTDGCVLEAGPFCGVIYDLVRQHIGSSFRIASFPSGMEDFYRGEIKKRNTKNVIDVIETTPAFAGIEDETVDLVVFRGALFFPALFRTDYRAIRRILRPGGVAFVGGGFGKYTPPEVIRSINERSRELNLRIGKTEVTVDTIRQDLNANNITEKVEILTEGGLWIVIKKAV